MNSEKERTFASFKRAVEDLKRGRKDQVAEYLRDIERRHNRELAEMIRQQVIDCAKVW